MKKRIPILTKIVFAVGIALIILTFYSFLYQDSSVSNFLKYYNGISSLIIMLLTIAYVYTTNRQLSSMEKQINLTDKSVNLQIQPLPIPRIDKIHLEKIKPYKGPEDDFTAIRIKYRFHYLANIENAGNGAALNVSVYSNLVFKKNANAISVGSKEQIYCIKTTDSQNKSNSHSMILDTDYSILKELLDGRLKLKIDIYYKNIFGAGFHEKATYSMSLSEENRKIAKTWLAFLEKYIEDKKTDLVRHKALAKTVPEDAEEIFNKIKMELKETYNEDLKIDYRIESSSFNVELIDYDDAIKIADTNIDEAYEKYREHMDCQNYDKAPQIKTSCHLKAVGVK